MASVPRAHKAAPGCVKHQTRGYSQQRDGHGYHCGQHVSWHDRERQDINTLDHLCERFQIERIAQAASNARPPQNRRSPSRATQTRQSNDAASRPARTVQRVRPARPVSPDRSTLRAAQNPARLHILERVNPTVSPDIDRLVVDHHQFAVHIHATRFKPRHARQHQAIPVVRNPCSRARNTLIVISWSQPRYLRGATMARSRPSGFSSVSRASGPMARAASPSNMVWTS